jgi:hypothetical protein
MSLTLGAAGQPNAFTANLDALLATSLANYNRTLIDNISKINAFLNLLMKNGGYKSAEGGTHIVEPLMYSLATADWYDGYDELSTDPTEGITQALFEFRQLAVPITYSEKERKMNKQRLVDLVDAKIKQGEMGIHEKLNSAILQGAGNGSLSTAQTSGLNGASGVDPLPFIVQYDPTASSSPGGIDQSTSTWWQNQYKVSTATSWAALFNEMQNMYNNCSKGPGGEPNLILCDQTTYETFQAAYFNKFRILDNDKNFDFEHFKFKKALVAWDEMVPNVFAGTTDTTTTTGGTAYFLNTKFFKLRYESSTNFVMGPFQKPVNQDAKVAHILWMGNLTCSNRRKQGVLGKISRAIAS